MKNTSRFNEERIILYIECTKRHFDSTKYEDKALNFFLDLDLISFTKENIDEYLKNNSGIEYEFSHHISREEWVKGRGDFLDMVINKEKIFRSDIFDTSYENRAKSNLKREKELLIR